MNTMVVNNDKIESTAEERSHLTLDKMDMRTIWMRWMDVTWNIGMQRLYSRMVEIDLTMAEQVALRRLRNRVLTVNEMAETMGVTPSAASRAVDRLVRDGLVVRTECVDDRRQRKLSLSAEGQTLMNQLNQGVFDGIEHVVGLLSVEDQMQFRQLLERMLDAYAVGQGAQAA